MADDTLMRVNASAKVFCRPHVSVRKPHIKVATMAPINPTENMNPCIAMVMSRSHLAAGSTKDIAWFSYVAAKLATPVTSKIKYWNLPLPTHTSPTIKPVKLVSTSHWMCDCVCLPITSNAWLSVWTGMMLSLWPFIFRARNNTLAINFFSFKTKLVYIDSVSHIENWQNICVQINTSLSLFTT